MNNNKPELLKEYMRVQGREIGAFNQAEQVTFNCGAMINFCKGTGNNKELKVCHNCPMFEEYQELLNDIEISDSPTKQEVQEYLKKLSKSTDLLFVEEKLREICEKTDFNLTVLKEQMKKYKKKIFYTRSNSATYKFDNTPFGTFFYKEEFEPLINDIVRHDIASFKRLKKENRIDIDVFHGKTEENPNNISAIPLLSPNMMVDAVNELETSYLLEACKHKKIYCLQPDDIGEFIKIFNENEEIERKQRKQVNIYCFQKEKYFEPDEYDCYNEKQTLDNGVRTIHKVKGFVDEGFQEFVGIKPDNKIIKQCIKELNSIPVNLEDAQIWKGIMCKSVAMMLKMDLISMGVKFFPIDIIMGDRGTGKTTLNKLLVRCLWNSVARSNTELSGSMGARLDYPNDIRPIVYEELTEFKKNWIDMLKEGMTAGVFTIKKGTAEGGMTIKRIYQNYFLDTNEFNVNDEAFEQRMCFWHKNIKIDGKDNLALINNLEANIKHVGKYLYDNFGKVNTSQLWLEAQDYIKTVFPTKDIRKGIKYSQIRFGELVIEKILPEIFEHVILDYPTLLDKKSYFLFNKRDMIKDKIKLLCSKVHIKIYGEPELTISSFLNSVGIVDNAKIQLYDKYGLIVSAGSHICLTRKFLPIINNELQGIKKFNNLKEISSILGIETKTTKYDVGENITTISAININELIKEE